MNTITQPLQLNLYCECEGAPLPRGMVYAPIVPHAERAQVESNAQSEFNTTGLRFFDVDNVTHPRPFISPMAAEYIPVLFDEPYEARTYIFFPFFPILSPR